MIKPKNIDKSKAFCFSYSIFINLTTLNNPITAPLKKINMISISISLTAPNTKEYVPNKRRIKLPDIPGTTRAVTAKKPEKNKYQGLISISSLLGIRNSKPQIIKEIISPMKNDLDNFGFKGSIKTEQNNKEDRKDLNAMGYASMVNKIRAERE